MGAAIKESMEHIERDDDAPVPPVQSAVEDRPEAIAVPNLPVSDAVPLEERTWLKKNKKYILGGLGVLIGTAVVAGVSVAVSSNNGSSGSNALDPEGVALPMARPSESSSPSDVPSLRPTLRHSQSLAPSTNPNQPAETFLRPTASSHPSQIPSPRPSLMPTPSPRPSLIPSPRPSSMPTPTPRLYCGEINILVDESYWQTHWTLRNTVTANGIPYPDEIVLDGSPEEEGRYTYKACLERGGYEFSIFDILGDGLSDYTVTFEKIVIAQGGGFGSEENVFFSLPSCKGWGLCFDSDKSHDLFGHAVALSADALTMAVGAPGRFGNDNRPGYVEVFRREGEGSSWEQRGETIRGEANGDGFGDSLALSDDGTILSIGAPRHDSVGPDSGRVEVYEWDEAALDHVRIGDALYGTVAGDNFGYSLDISNSKILAVGSNKSGANDIPSGQVTVYAWDDASSSFQQRGEAIDGNEPGDFFGNSVSLAENGQKLAIGSPLNFSDGVRRGDVKVFEWDEASSNYVQLGDSLRGDAALDWFGDSVSISRDGTTLAVGAPRNSKTAPFSGQVKVFALDEAASNFEQIGPSLYGKKRRDSFGSSVALSSAGTTLAVGADQFPGNGYVEVYEWDESDSEYKRRGQDLRGEASRARFGYALALAGNGRVLAVGAPENKRNGPSSGFVEVFNIEL